MKLPRWIALNNLSLSSSSPEYPPLKPVPLNRAAKVSKVFIPASAHPKKIISFSPPSIPPRENLKTPKNSLKAGAKITHPIPLFQILFGVFLRKLTII
jgi:hypothetical protein